jgi:hypothetical protein
MRGESWNRPGNRNTRPSRVGDVAHASTDLRVFSDTSNCTGRPVLLWMTDTQSRTEPPATRSTTLKRTRSQLRSLPSIARLNNARFRQLSASSSRARMAQTCLGTRGPFWPMSCPLFHGRRCDLVAGSWKLDVVRSPHPALPRHASAQHRDAKSTACRRETAFGRECPTRIAAAQWPAWSPKQPDLNIRPSLMQ